ncbi:transglycosylase [Saccharicrinis sp. FJH54]|uniref:transglycosylase n=1 Tax=Saccharicrinis sp. FJH54 TaxID=3344665 RepID=UPI0035D52062
MRVAGIVLLVLGLIGTVVFGIQALNDSESLNVLGVDVAVSSANWTPLIISGIVLLIGFFMTARKKTA